MKILFAKPAIELRGAKAQKRIRERAKLEQDARERGDDPPLSDGQSERVQALVASLTQKPAKSSASKPAAKRPAIDITGLLAKGISEFATEFGGTRNVRRLVAPRPAC